MNTVPELGKKIITLRKLHPSSIAFTVAISGIDASGKGYIGKQLETELQKNGFKVANINIDPWQNPIPIRLKYEKAAENLYENIFRWNDFFEQLIFPLKKNKSIYLETKGIHTHADEFYPLIYDFQNIDILLVEGILLFKKQFLSYFDYKIWIDCSFETGLKRAIHRNIEKKEKEKLIEDYETFYYAAQRLHFKKDDPKTNADFIFINE